MKKSSTRLIVLLLATSANISPALSQWLNTPNGNGIYLPIGRVGIGINNPSEVLEVMGSGKFNNYLKNSQSIRIGHDGAHSLIDGTEDLLINYYTAKNVIIGTGNKGNLGIGYGNPEARLVISDNGNNFLRIYGNAAGDVFSSGSFRPHFTNGDFSIFEGAPGTGKLRLSVLAGNGNTLLVPYIGNVGVGTLTPTDKLTIQGKTGEGDIALRIKSINNSNIQSEVALLAPVSNGLPEGQIHFKGRFLFHTIGHDGFDGIPLVINNNGTVKIQAAANNEYALRVLNGGGSGNGLLISSSAPGSDGNLLVVKNGRYDANNNPVDNPADYILKVNSKDRTVYARELEVTLNNFPDYVFKPGYKLMPLDSLAQFIKSYGHLPNIPSESEIKKDGLNVGNIIKAQMEKIEELTLYIIELEKRIKSLERKN